MSGRLQQIKYPFSAEARKTSQKMARDLGVLVELLDEQENHYIVEEAEKRVYAALTQSQIRYPTMENEKDVLIYPTARLIVEELGLPRLRALQAEAESKEANRQLGKENSDLVIELCKSSFNWSIESMGAINERSKLPLLLRTFEMKIRFENYLEVAPGFHSEEWSLINRYLDKGWIPIRRSELDRLISGKFKQLIMGGRFDIPKMSRRLIETVQRIEAETKGRIRQAEPVKMTETVVSAFPPCIQKMYDDSIRGDVNLSHDARFALAAFLLKIGMEANEVEKVFSSSPDKNISLIEYQVRHIASKRSMGVEDEGYTPPGCKKMQVNNLCPVYLGTASDPLCEYILNPLAFYQTRAWEITKNIQDHSWYARKRDKKQNF
jgi:DNA primase large subunit